MKVNAQGVLSKSNIYFHTPSETARKLFFYLVCTGHYFCDGTYVVNRKSYNSFLVLMVLKGKGYVEQGGRRSLLTEGSIALLDCYSEHIYGTDTGWEIIWCHYDGAMARPYYESVAQDNNCILTLQNPYTAQRNLEKLYAMAISSKVGKILNTAKFSRKPIPLVPRSMSRLMPPVWRDK